MTRINIGPGFGFNANLLDPDNPLYPVADLNGAWFNGFTFIESHGTNPTVFESPTQTISFWYKIGIEAPKSPVNILPILTNEDAVCYKSPLQIYFEYNETIGYSNLTVLATGSNIANTTSFTVEDVETHDDTWHHVAIYMKAWGEGESINKVYIDEVNQIFTNTTDFTYEAGFARYDYWAVGAGLKADTQRLTGCMDELYITFDDLDISVAANLAKFINSTTSEPVPLGPTGNLPTGSSAYIYLKDSGASFANNYGSRSDPFIVQGEIQSCDSKTGDEPLIGYNSVVGTIDIIGNIPEYSES